LGQLGCHGFNTMHALRQVGWGLLLLLGGLKSPLALALTPPASLVGRVISISSMVHSSSKTYFQSDGRFYDFERKGSDLAALPLRLGTYSYTANGDNTATLTLSYRDTDGTLLTNTSTLNFDTDSSGYVGSPGFFFSIESAPDQAVLGAISTRSLVSPSVPAIAGFVVYGTTPRLYLIRVVGPTLRQYGVTDAVSDVSLKLFKGSSQIAQNDDWEKSTINVADLTQTFARVGAFGLPTGSKDAVILTALDPGIYTAQGFATETGELLVEVYQMP